ncbi:Fmp41 protein [Starmerella bacillaris]|uniref:Fmp41 protein n=1 Tax=Starmerella bacillaris TaxID=1247836 RepID=A0AAV5RJ05_STABA|nr:Fmp41 protein [Starmerella bacillaris]
MPRFKDAFKIGQILAVGRNYVEHAKELQNNVPKQPFFFAKPPTSVLWQNEGPIFRPNSTKVHYEIELAVVIGKELHLADPATFSKQDALSHIAGYALALDMTAREVQKVTKAKGLPWTIAKGFDTFLPLSEFIPADRIADFNDLQLQLTVNDEMKQNDNTNLMIFKIPYLLAYISNITRLRPGDVILTGTPKGVGETVPGDKLKGKLLFGQDTITSFEFSVADRKVHINLPEVLS